MVGRYGGSRTGLAGVQVLLSFTLPGQLCPLDLEPGKDEVGGQGGTREPVILARAAWALLQVSKWG